MIDVICDPGSRYTKLVARRRARGAAATESFALVVPSQEAVELRRLARGLVAPLRPGWFEAVRYWVLGDEGAGPVAGFEKASVVGRGAAIARAVGLLAPEVLAVDCGALRTRVFEVAHGSARTRPIENDRCNAGGGRFVETMAAALGVALEGLDACAASARTPYRVSSPCPVFAESEVVSQINAGSAREDVLAGVLAHAVEKVAGLVTRARPGDRPLVPVGGLARWAAFRRGLADALPGVRVLSLDADPLLAGCQAALSVATSEPLRFSASVIRLPMRARDAA